jgi:glycerophosphoryl diester phosphodiesterase
LPELKELDAGSWFAPSFVGQRIPTLQEVIEAVGQHLLLNIELKVRGSKTGRLAAAVARAVEDHQLLDRALVSSFNPLALYHIRRLNPWISTGLLYSGDMPRLQRRPWLRHLLRPQALHPDEGLVHRDYVAWAKKRGYRIHTWTVDDPGRMWQLVRLGVDAIITNRPDLMGQVLTASTRTRGAPPSTISQE